MSTENLVTENPADPPALPLTMRTHVSLHLFFMLFSAVLIGLSFFFVLEGNTGVRIPGMPTAMPETCNAKRMFGIDCPGCGLTRSFISMSSGRFQKAIRFNPSGPLSYLFVLIQIPWHLFQLIRLMIGKIPVESVWLYVPIYVVCGAMMLQWIWRIVL